MRSLVDLDRQDASPPQAKRLLVATCIGCGARSRAGDCPDGCADVPLDLVETASVDMERARVEALRVRVAALRAVAEVLAGDSPFDWGRLREQARQALGVALPANAQPTEIVEAWGCPDCGRIDAPQPFLGVCIRRPVAMTDAREYRAVAEEIAAAAAAERALTTLARLPAHVRPSPRQAQRTRLALAARARAVLATVGPDGA